MRHSIFPFGQTIEGYTIPVLNERAVRAGAGILFFFAMMTFMNAWLVGNFAPTRLFIVAFLIDFSIRLFVSPKYAPSLIAGQWLVRKQTPEYTGAAQKAFAWAIGFVLSLFMFFLMVVNQVIGPINMLVCATCLILMWFETSAGICLGCKMYNAIAKDPAQLCPGDTCTYTPLKGAGGNWLQGLIVVAFLGVVFMTGKTLLTEQASRPLGKSSINMQHSQITEPTNKAASPTDAARCVVPEFAKAMGHEEKWKSHNNCN